MSKRVWTIIVLQWLVTAAVGCHFVDDRDHGNSFPRRPIKVIVPFAAGGGSDTFGRIIQSSVEEQDLLPEKLVIINVPGAGGTIGSRRVKNARPDGYTILLLHEAILTAKYSGQASYGPEVFDPIAGSGDATQVVAVAADSPYSSLSELMDRAAGRPDEIVFSANIGAPSHFAGLMLEQQKEGAQFRYTQTGGGAKRFAALQGGHVDVTSFSIAEYIQFRSAGLRALALLGPDQHPELPDLPTAGQQGFDVVSQNMQFWWAPAGTSPERIEVIAGAIEEAMKSDEVQEKLAQMQIDPRFLKGPQLDREIQKRADRLSAVASRTLGELPDFPRIVFAVVLLLAAAAWYQSRAAGKPVAADVPSGRLAVVPAAAVLGMTLLYVATLQMTPVGFRLATLVYVLSVSASVFHFSADGARGSLPVARFVSLLGLLALFLSLGVHFLFTQVLVVDLP